MSDTELAPSPELEARRERQQFVLSLERQAKRLRDLSYEAKSYEEDGPNDWPNTEPVPGDMWVACSDVIGAINALEHRIAETKRLYRKRVLEWLLAETEANG